jgi:hypothetical protein
LFAGFFPDQAPDCVPLSLRNLATIYLYSPYNSDENRSAKATVQKFINTNGGTGDMDSFIRVAVAVAIRNIEQEKQGEGRHHILKMARAYRDLELSTLKSIQESMKGEINR